MAIVHGYAEHSGRYDGHARRLQRRGISIAAFDHRGHGLSDGTRGLIGSYLQSVQDTHRFLAWLRTERGATPLILFGHSMGGTIAGIAAIDRPADIAGVVLSSPALEFPQPSWLQKASLLLEKLIPIVPIESLDRSLLSRRPEVKADTDTDPLYYRGRVSVKTGAQLIRAARHLLRDAINLHVPLLILHGTADRLTLPSGSTRLYKRAGTNDKALCLFPEAYHETFNDEHGERVLDRITEFVEECLDPPQPTD
jgi:alpha-beta hydrolase superfamily lysophospholipase